MAYSILLFDLDGTLIDPKVGITAAMQNALNKVGIYENLETLTRFIGPPLNVSLKEYYGFSDEQTQEVIRYFREYFIPEGMFDSIIYQGVPELLTKLKTNEKKLYVVTSKPTNQAERIIKHHGLDPFFEKIIGTKNDLSDADKTILIQETLAIHPDEEKQSFVMIGDREFDAIGAKANKIDSIGVLYGYGSLEELNKAKPTYLAKTIAELEQYL